VLAINATSSGARVPVAPRPRLVPLRSALICGLLPVSPSPLARRFRVDRAGIHDNGGVDPDKSDELFILGNGRWGAFCNIRRSFVKSLGHSA